MNNYIIGQLVFNLRNGDERKSLIWVDNKHCTIVDDHGMVKLNLPEEIVLSSLVKEYERAWDAKVASHQFTAFEDLELPEKYIVIGPHIIPVND